MDDHWRFVFEILLVVILVLLNAVFASAEIAVISFNDYKLKKLAEDKNKKAMRLLKLTQQPAKFLSTIQIGITLAGFLASAFAADNFSEYLAPWLYSVFPQISQGLWNSISLVIITLILSYFTLVFGELVPKRIAMKYDEKIAMALANFIFVLSKITSPAVSLLTASTDGILRLFGISPDDEEEKVTEEEIRFMVDVGSENGTIDPIEKDMIQNVFEFDNIDAANVLTHRTEVCVLMQEDSPTEWEKIVRETGYSRFPVCGETIDDILGIIHARDLYEYLYDKCEGDINDIIRPAYVVPETVTADVLFRNMKREKQHLAVVVDEYGGFSGIVTIDDLLEEIVGEITDENEEGEEVPPIVKISDDTWQIVGIAPIDEVEEVLEIELPHDDDYDTFGGFIFNRLDSVPRDGETFEIEACDLKIKVTEISDRRIEKTIVKKLSSQNTEEN